MAYEIGLFSIYGAEWGRGVMCHMAVFYSDGTIVVHLGDRVRGWSLMEEDLEHVRALGGVVKTLVDNEVRVMKATMLGDTDETAALSAISLAILMKRTEGDNNHA